ncbi:NlpC/P60 family protein [Thermomonospora echinospora]|uniref:NlpC/P60 family protein n=1 Tax=Thermomonospora echinospora TaxID=1992 RepID=A0A1H6A4Y3_9ACTN|nr:C40 family peptidase [Thermomonospora echinospora]SEG43491.1 NlpC/P60 family protein [Thermomonospora echinospora]
MIRRTRGRTGDEGLATTLLVLYVSLALAAATLLIFKIAEAGDMRTQAQIGADAAALGALEPLRNQAIDLALEGISPSGVGYWMTNTEPEVPAKRYAGENETDLVGEVKLSGRLGTTAKVSTVTRKCQLKNERNLTDKERRALQEGEDLCTGTDGEKGVGRAGKATAVGRLIIPDCVYPPIPGDQLEDGNPDYNRLVCDGVQVWPNGDRDRVAKMFKLRLVDAEDPVAYKGGPDYDDIFPPGQVGPLPQLPELPADASDLIKKILAYAYAQIGKPYLWGGVGPSAFDCSGLIYAAYKSAGVAIPRTTFTQWPFGVRVPGGAEKPGDLIFFNSGPGSGPNRPGHVAMVVDPEKKLMIEARCRLCGPISVTSYANRPNVMGFTRPLARFGKE